MGGRKPGNIRQGRNHRLNREDDESPGVEVAALPAWFLFPVSTFFDELRRHGFSIGVDTVERAEYVIMKAIEAGDEARLDLWLCPVLAHTPEQQSAFREIYNRLFIPALESPEEGREKPEKESCGDGKRAASPGPPDAPAKSNLPVSAEPVDGRRKVVASLKSRTSAGFVLDRFVRSAEMASDPVLLKVVRQLRFTRESGRYDFDVRATIRKTTRSGGFATPLFSARRHHVEYLMLIDRHNDRDHRAHLHDSLYETLRENNIFVERFWFDHSPLICRNERHPGGIAIGELLSLYGHAVLLLFADGRQFIDTLRLEIFPWAQVFRHWSHRCFISSVPPVLWGRREMLLGELFPALLPLSTEALRMLADDLDENDGGDSDRVRYRQEGADYSLVPIRIDEKRFDEIALFFSRSMQRWIAACAVYPELNWNLTLALGQRLSRQIGGPEPLNSWQNVSRLLRLEWFIRGRIPDAFRLQLIESWLNKPEVADICRFLHEQLGSAPALAGQAGYEGAALQLAIYDLLGEENAERKQEKRERLHDLLEHETRLPDIVTLHYADTINPLDFEIPEYLLERIGVDVGELKRQAKPPLPENFVLIKGGTFMMGSPESERDIYDDETLHEVKVSDFAMCRYAVTVQEYLEFAEQTKGHYPVWLEKGNEYHIKTGSNEYYKKLGEALTGKNHPVVGVSWNDAVAFCAWLSEKRGGGTYRLPTEAEWEYACRAGTATPFSTGENLTTDQANYDGNYPYGKNPKGKYREKTVPVDYFQPNGYGLYNMHGNVWEWCSDWFGNDYYEECRKQGVVENPRGPETGSSRVLRGGSWYYDARDCRSAYRYDDGPGSRFSHVGFRLVFVPQFKSMAG